MFSGIYSVYFGSSMGAGGFFYQSRVGHYYCIININRNYMYAVLQIYHIVSNMDFYQQENCVTQFAYLNMHL